MNAEHIPPPVTDEPDQEIAKALVLLFRLPQDAVDSINASARTLGMTFEEAALHTGLVTSNELSEAREFVRRQNTAQAQAQAAPGRGRGSIVEEALRRHSTRRDVVVWEGEKLKPGRSLILAHDPDNPRSEAIRSLRTELLMRTHGRRGTAMFALLSPNAGEGRSQLAAELAIAFAQLGSRTLLVDTDMRRPRQHVLFGADNGIGLAQALGETGAQRIYGVEGMPQLGVLTSGGLPPNPLELLAASRIERLMAEWRRSYEYVILDTPPTSEFSDALAVAAAAGNVIILGRTNSTSFAALTQMRRKLETSNGRILGAVMNNF